jgi:hypothetical protein
MRRADNLTTFMCRLSINLGASTSWNPKGLSRPVMGLLFTTYTYERCSDQINFWQCFLIFTAQSFVSYVLNNLHKILWCYMFFSMSVWNLADKLKDQSVYERGVLVKKYCKTGPCSPLYVWTWNEKTRESFNCEVNHLTPTKNKGVDRNWHTSPCGHCHSVNHGQRHGLAVRT